MQVRTQWEHWEHWHDWEATTHEIVREAPKDPSTSSSPQAHPAHHSQLPASEASGASGASGASEASQHLSQQLCLSRESIARACDLEEQLLLTSTLSASIIPRQDLLLPNDCATIFTTLRRIWRLLLVCQTLPSWAPWSLPRHEI